MEKKKKRKFWERLKEKWGLKSYWQVGLIIIVFSIAGSTVAFARPYYFAYLGFDKSTPWIFKLLIGVLTYQVVLLIYGTIFGQFKFFWQKEKRMISRIGKFFAKVISFPSSLVGRK